MFRFALPTLLILCIATHAAGQTQWNREVTGIAALAASGSPGTYDVHIAWTFGVSDPSAAPLDLSTEIEVSVNGSPIGSQIVPVSVNGPIADCATGGCSGSCGNSTVDGLANDLFCHPVECDCRPLDFTGTFPGTPLTPGDEIVVILRPAPGAVPEQDSSDDSQSVMFDGERWWDRGIQDVQLQPSAGGPNTYDVHVTWGVSSNIDETLPVGAQIVLLVGGVDHTTVDGCFDTIAAGPACTSLDCSISSPCGTGDCFGSPQQGFCAEIEGAGGQTHCGCRASSSQVIPGVVLQPNDEITVLLRPAPGALPTLPGLDEDDESTGVNCTADLDDDGDVDLDDLTILLQNFGDPGPNSPGDVDGDGDTDLDDLTLLLQSFNANCV